MSPLWLQINWISIYYYLVSLYYFQRRYTNTFSKLNRCYNNNLASAFMMTVFADIDVVCIFYLKMFSPKGTKTRFYNLISKLKRCYRNILASAYMIYAVVVTICMKCVLKEVPGSLSRSLLQIKMLSRSDISPRSPSVIRHCWWYYVISFYTFQANLTDDFQV